MTFARVPETEIIMEKADSVSAFFDAGRRGGPLAPIYQFSCRALSQLLPKNGVVLDIGCGPAQFLTRLLQYRPDLQGIGADLSQRMLATAGNLAEECGVAARIEFVQADFANVDQAVSGGVDGIVCISALHHCPDFDSLVTTLSAIKRLSDRRSGAIWLFDLVRPEIGDLCELIQT
jgi:arsenite methyltransferase